MGHPQHQSSAAHVSAAGHVDGRLEDTEWEYEYDDNETEDLYFTLDLTTHVPDALTRKYETAPDSHGAARAAPNGDAQQRDAAIEDAPPKPGITYSRPRPALQILELHSRNPLVKFDGGIYSCYWSTDLGTQFHIAQAGATAEPKRAGTVLDVVGLSQARLIGKPVTLKQKKSNVADRAQSPADNDGVDQQNDVHDEVQPAPTTLNDPTKPLVIPRELCKDGTAESQASFLEKLSEIKLKKGETDPVPMYSIRSHKDPRNKDELRKRAMEEDGARKKDEAAVAADKPRKRRKRLTAVEKGLIPSDSPKPLAGRQDRAALGARVGFEGQAPGALATTRKKSKRGRSNASGTAVPDAAEDDGAGEAASAQPDAEDDSDVQMGDPN
ncbi:putative transcription factor TFIIIC, triple barrel domain-containing protein [Septoria linicola]|nr:putative transcription factor TFIIIC, triple barrel domain-containing protein [Septoria linicola]